MRPLNILVSAYACKPNAGSEPGVGWNTVQELAKHANVWVLTRQDNRPEIEAELAKNPIPKLQFIYCNLLGEQLWKQGLQGVHMHYYLWQLKAFFVARNLYKTLKFDIAHHVTYVRYSTPSFLSFLPIPFIWGPVGGGEAAPKSFWQDFSLRGKVYEVLRRLAHRLGELDPFVQLTAQRSTLIRATTDDTAKRLHQLGATNVQVFSESGLSQQEIEQLAQQPLLINIPVRFISMARLLHWKGLYLGIRAFAKANLPEGTEYWILGEGPEYDRLQALATELGVAHQVKLLGRLPRDKTLQKLSQCHVLVHPSLHDSGGWVCLEAMAAGRPVVCLDLGGPAVQVTLETGFKVPASDPEQAVDGLAAAITTLAKDAGIRSRMGSAGQQRVREHFSWEVKGQQLIQLYQEIVEQEEHQQGNY